MSPTPRSELPEGYWALVVAQMDGKPWTWKPEWYWTGWRGLIPFHISHDELARWTLVVGWTFTGRVVFPLWPCGDQECTDEAASELALQLRRRSTAT